MPGYVGGVSRVQLAVATDLSRSGRADEAAPILDRVVARHLRRVGSAQIRRVAASLRAAVADPARGR